MNKEAQTIFSSILVKLECNENLTDYESSFLRARRSYLSKFQKIKYLDILYLNKQFLFYKSLSLRSLVVKIIEAILLAIIVSVIVKHLGF